LLEYHIWHRGNGDEHADFLMFSYFPANFMWSGAVNLSMMAGGELGQIDRWLAPPARRRT
jgi:hypothetical protein